MKTFLLLLLLSLPAHADILTNLEVECWSKASDDDGSLLCQYLVIMGEANGKRVFPDLAAVDVGGPKTLEQARRACVAMGYPYALGFELLEADKDKLLVVIEEGTSTGSLYTGRGSYIQHLRCADL